MTVTANYRPSQKIPVEPSVLPVYILNSYTEVLVDVPWKNCKMIGATFSCLVANGAAATSTIDMELNAAGGGDMYSITIPNSLAVGTVTTATLVTAANCKNLDRDVAARDQINIEVTVGSGTNWAGMLYMYFEPMI